MGLGYGYFPNTSKTTPLVKPEFIEEATKIFEASRIKITTDSQKILALLLRREERECMGKKGFSPC